MKGLNELKIALQFKEIAESFKSAENNMEKNLCWIRFNTLSNHVANMYFLNKISEKFYEKYREGEKIIKETFGEI
jgi:hypothetical protein